MTADVVNLRQARKAKARAAHAAKGDAQRLRHGRTKAERDIVTRETEIAARRLDGHRLTDGDDGALA